MCRIALCVSECTFGCNNGKQGGQTDPYCSTAPTRQGLPKHGLLVQGLGSLEGISSMPGGPKYG